MRRRPARRNRDVLLVLAGGYGFLLLLVVSAFVVAAVRP